MLVYMLGCVWKEDVCWKKPFLFDPKGFKVWLEVREKMSEKAEQKAEKCKKFSSQKKI